MPTIDVTDILFDLDIAGQSFSVIRRQGIVNSYGEETITNSSPVVAAGSVQPTGDNSLSREEAFQTQGDSIRVITTFRLRGAGKDLSGNIWQPDIVVWNNSRYIVRVINDYTQFGAGYVDAECVSIDRVQDVTV